MSPEFGFSRENDNHNTLVYTGAHGLLVKVKSAYEPHQAGAYPGFYSMKRLGVFLLPLDGMLVNHSVTPSIKFAGTHLYTRVEKVPGRARTQTARSGVESTNHEPPRLPVVCCFVQ